MRRLLTCSYLAFAVASSDAAAAAEKLTIATVAPEQSAWGKVFSAWAKAVDKKSGGSLELLFYWNASQGDERTVVGKLRSGQLDGCTLGAQGLAEMHKPVLALQMPGLFSTWEGIDRAGAALFDDFRAAFDQQGLYLSSLGDVGRAHTMARGRAVRTPEDVKLMKPASPHGGVIAPVLASLLGVTPVRLGLPEILPALTARRIDLITVPPLAAEQLQWAPHLDHIHEDVAGVGIGALVLSKKRLDALDPDVLEVLKKTGKKAGAMLRERVRRMDDEAYARLSRRMTVVRLTRSERQRWSELFAKVRRVLAKRDFSPALVKKLEKLADPPPS